MTDLRDKIAIAAMAACIAGDDVLTPDDKCEGRKTVSLEKTASWAYEMADAMLEAREQPK